MKKIKSVVCLSLLLVVTWLTGYQICDASEDAAEQVAACAQIASAGMSLHTPAAPDEDADALIPIVVGQSLTPQPVLLETPRLAWIPRGLHETQVLVIAACARQNLIWTPSIDA